MHLDITMKSKQEMELRLRFFVAVVCLFATFSYKTSCLKYTCIIRFVAFSMYSNGKRMLYTCESSCLSFSATTDFSFHSSFCVEFSRNSYARLCNKSGKKMPKKNCRYNSIVTTIGCNFCGFAPHLSNAVVI